MLTMNICRCFTVFGASLWGAAALSPFALELAAELLELDGDDDVAPLAEAGCGGKREESLRVVGAARWMKKKLVMSALVPGFNAFFFARFRGVSSSPCGPKFTACGCGCTFGGIRSSLFGLWGEQSVCDASASLWCCCAGCSCDGCDACGDCDGCDGCDGCESGVASAGAGAKFLLQARQVGGRGLLLPSSSSSFSFSSSSSSFFPC